MRTKEIKLNTGKKFFFAFLFKAPHLQSQTIFAKHYQGALQFSFLRQFRNELFTQYSGNDLRFLNSMPNYTKAVNSCTKPVS